MNNKTILIGISGGIAAYKICSLIREYKKSGANVKVVCTPNALNFVTKLTLQNLTQNEVYVQEFDVNNWKPEHISLADEADIMVIAPATANTISKIALGIADNLLTSVACAFTKKIIIAPAMNCNMWQNEAVVENLSILRNRGVEILEPEKGFLACGYIGKGRLCDIKKIFDATKFWLEFSTILKDKKVLITSGGTIEEIDPVRYISNYSSGKMGLALAKSALAMGADVHLITTKDVEIPCKVTKVKSALEMQKAINEDFDNSDYIIMAAAVADYRVKHIAEQKIKKTDEEIVNIELIKNPDILAELCNRRKLSDKETVIVGFCAESEKLHEHAEDKIKKKGCDFLVANDISRSDIGFNTNENEVVIFDCNGKKIHLNKASKLVIARKILEIISGFKNE